MKQDDKDTAIPNEILATEVIKQTKENVEKQESLVQRVTDAKIALDLACSTFKRESLNYLKDIDTHLNSLRMSRMAIEQEQRQLMNSFSDVRKFFLSDEHKEEVKLLNEFVDMCNQLKKLKESGFLDAIADTILKL